MGDLTLLRPLGSAGIETIVATVDRHDPTLRSRYAKGACIIPGFGHGTAEATVRALERLGERMARESGTRAPLLFGTDAQLALVYEFQERLAAHYLFLVNERELGRALLDKLRFSAVARAAKIPSPRTLSGIDALDSSVLGPVFVKPMRKTAWRTLQEALFQGSAKGRRFSSARELRENQAFCAHAGELVVQECIDPAPAGLLSFHGFANEESRILASFCGRKIRTSPAVAGESSFIEVVDDPAVQTLGEQVVRALGLRGPFKIDIVREKGTLRDWVLEVNARFTLWSYLGAVNGINLPAIACAHLLRRSIPDHGRARHDTRWLNFYRDWQAFRVRRTGPLEAVRYALSLSPWGKVYESFAWDDPYPFAWWLGQMLLARARRGPARHALEEVL